MRLIEQNEFDLVISDLGMPMLDGNGLIQRIREKHPQLPVIVLSARSAKPEITTSLRLGADDFVTKPFGLEELSLRVAAVLRRTQKQPEALFTCGPIVMDDERHIVTLDGKPVELSPTEFELLRALMAKPGKVVSKTALMSQVWHIGFQTDTNVLATYISYLRKKLHTPTWQGIKTVRGIGFQIAES
jgi:two-component system OmpR family response regulator